MNSGNNRAVLSVNDSLPIRTEQPVHSGKVRSVYWLTASDSRRLIKEKKYNVAADSDLAVMVISDRLSAFDCLWHGEGGLTGVPGKGAALNTISKYWFDLFRNRGLADHHIVDVPHPLVWIVRRARPVMVEAICRQYITGSMWRAYNRGERRFCGIELADGLKQNQKLPELLLTPSTKGILTGIEGVPAMDDVNITRADIERNWAAFGFRKAADIAHYEKLVREGFTALSDAFEQIGQIFVDTKFEFGYVKDAAGRDQLIYMDEVGTPDSSRIWDERAWRESDTVVENSKEGFRQALLQLLPNDVLLDSTRMEERRALATKTEVPHQTIMDVSRTYIDIAEKITGEKVPVPENAEADICNILHQQYGLLV